MTEDTEKNYTVLIGIVLLLALIGKMLLTTLVIAIFLLFSDVRVLIVLAVFVYICFRLEKPENEVNKKEYV